MQMCIINQVEHQMKSGNINKQQICMKNTNHFIHREMLPFQIGKVYQGYISNNTMRLFDYLIQLSKLILHQKLPKLTKDLLSMKSNSIKRLFINLIWLLVILMLLRVEIQSLALLIITLAIKLWLLFQVNPLAY